jgi:hypothetical protein
MNNLQLGKMYLVKEFFWLLFPTKELAALEGVAGWRAVQSAKWYSEYLNCNVDVVEENTCFVLLEKDGGYYKLLDSNGNIGWIGCWDFSKYFEVLNE